jgi:hypothetical protein
LFQLEQNAFKNEANFRIPDDELGSNSRMNRYAIVDPCWYVMKPSTNLRIENQRSFSEKRI